MPIYEYRCESCGHEHDALQKISEAPLKDCPACSASALKRLISAPSFRLKGSGWYETDFKSDKEKRRNLAETADAGKSDSKADSKGEAKKPEKSEAKGGEAKKADAKPVKPAASKGSGNEAA